MTGKNDRRSRTRGQKATSGNTSGRVTRSYGSPEPEEVDDDEDRLTADSDYDEESVEAKIREVAEEHQEVLEGGKIAASRGKL